MEDGTRLWIKGRSFSIEALLNDSDKVRPFDSDKVRPFDSDKVRRRRWTARVLTRGCGRAWVRPMFSIRRRDKLRPE